MKITTFLDTSKELVQQRCDGIVRKWPPLIMVAIDYQVPTLFYVDYCDKLSNLFEDLLKLNEFAERVEDETKDLEAKYPNQDAGL